MRLSRSSLLYFSLALLTVALGVATNVATSRIPPWLQPYLWLSWPVLGVLAFLFIILSVVAARQEKPHVPRASELAEPNLTSPVPSADVGPRPSQSMLITSIDPRRDFLVQDGKRRPIRDNPTLRAVMKRLGIKEIRPLSDKKIYEYPLGDAVPSEAPEVVQDGRGIRYLVARNVKKQIPNDATLKALGGDPRHVPTKPDEYLARFQEGSPLPEEWGEQWFTSKPRLERVDVGFISEFLVCGRICRYIPKPEWVEELRKGLSINRIETIDEQKLESYVEGVPIGSERDVQIVLLQLCIKGSSGALV
jgi:hypothetical protein